LSRSCGSCSACCTVLGVTQMQPEPKPPHQRCAHDSLGRGCRIYADRPQGCREYACLWLLDPEFLHERDRPDRLGLIFDLNPDFAKAHGDRALIAREVWAGSIRAKRAGKVLAAITQSNLKVVLKTWAGRRLPEAKDA